MIDNNSTHFSDQTIRRFLLGCLGQAEQESFEKALMVDDDLEGRMRADELALSDEYAGGLLSSADRDLCQQNFLITDDRKRALNVSTALHRYFSHAQSPRLRFWQRVRLALSAHQPIWRHAFAGLILAILLATTWLASREPKFEVQFSPPKGPVNSRNASTPFESNHPRSTALPPHHDASPAPSVHEESVLTVTLRSEDGPSEIDLANETLQVIRLQFALETKADGTYGMDLISSNGESILQAQAVITSDEHAVNFDVPARLLKSGNYQIKISHIGVEVASPVTYYLRVR